MSNLMQLEPQARAFAEANANPPYLPDLGPLAGRDVVDQVQSGPVDKPEVDIEDLTVAGGPSGQLSIRIVRPPGAAATLPVILYIHGAGWVFGDVQTHDRLIRKLAVGVEAAVVFPNYSRSPEAKYPTALEECYAVAKWIVAEGAAHGLDPQRLAIAGDSCGGNLAAALTLLAKERSGPMFRRQALFYPVTDADFDTESYHQFAEGYFLRRDAMMWFWDQYTSDPAERAQATVSPLRATLEELSGLPEALVITDEADVLRDEGEAYARKLREAGVRVTAARFDGVIHDFMMLHAMAHTAATEGAFILATNWLREGLHAA